MHALKTYSELKQLFMKKVANHYSFREQEQLFFLVLFHLNKWSKVDFSMYRNNLVKENYFERCLSIIEQLNLEKPIQHILGFTSFYELDLKYLQNFLSKFFPFGILLMVSLSIPHYRNSFFSFST